MDQSVLRHTIHNKQIPVKNSFLKQHLMNPTQCTLFTESTQRQFSENICSEDDLRSKIFGTFFVKFLACLPPLGFSNI